MIRSDIAEAAGEHDGFMITANLFGVGVVSGGRHFLFEGAEIAVDRGATELVVKRSATEGAFDHDIECGNDAVGFAEVLFPRLFGAGDAEIGNGETSEAGLRSRASSRGPFITDFAA